MKIKTQKKGTKEKNIHTTKIKLAATKKQTRKRKDDCQQKQKCNDIKVK